MAMALSNAMHDDVLERRTIGATYGRALRPIGKWTR
jgi:hypothetical protein